MNSFRRRIHSINEDIASIRKRVDDQTDALRKRSERWSRHQEEYEAEEDAKTKRISKRIEYIANGLNKRLSDIVETWKGVCDIIGEPDGIEVIADNCNYKIWDEIDEDFLNDNYDNIINGEQEICRITKAGEVVLKLDYNSIINTYSLDPETQNSIGAWCGDQTGFGDVNWSWLNLTTDAFTFVEEMSQYFDDNTINESVSGLKPLVDKLEKAVEIWANEKLDENERKVIRGK